MSYMRQREALRLSEFVEHIKLQVLSIETDDKETVQDITRNLESLEHTLFYKSIPHY